MRNKLFANGFLILALIMSATASLFAQNYRDSLLNLLTPDLDNDAKARIYCNIAKYENDPDTINKYARLAEESVSDSTDIKAEAISYRAYVLYNEMNYEKSLQLYREAFELCKNSNKKYLSNKMLMNQGCCLEAMENIAGALEKYSEALERSRQLGDTTIILWIYENMCTICSEAKIFRLAEGYSNMALALCKASQSPDQLVIAYEIKAQMLFVKSFTSHGHERDSLLREATIYCDSVKNIVERTKCADFECLSALNEVNLIKCKIYLYQANKKNNKAYSDTARKYLTLYENWSHELRDSTAQYIIYLHTAEYYYINGEYKKSLAISENINDAAITKKYDKVALYKLISDTYFKLKQYDKSHLWEEKLLALANDGTESRILSQIAESHIQQTNQIMQRNAELDKQQRQQEYQQDINDKKNKLKMLIVALCFCFVLVIVALFYVRRKRTMSRILETKNSALLQKQEEIIQQQNVITQQKEKAEQTNAFMLQSIRYARHIQRTALPSSDDVKALFPDCFLCYMPKDIVSGDFYYVTKKGDFNVMVIADCTGHGVPGGFLSMFGISAITEILARTNDDIIPGIVLDNMRDFVKEAFSSNESYNDLSDDNVNNEYQSTNNHNDTRSESDESSENNDESFSTADGMDMSICAVNFATREIRFAGAYHSAYIWSKGTITRLKGNRMPIGRHIKEDGAFSTITQTLQQGDMLYMMTDGIQGQMGGLSGTKFMTKRLLQFFSENASFPCEKQKECFENVINDWMYGTMQVDDITLAGIRIG